MGELLGESSLFFLKELMQQVDSLGFAQFAVPMVGGGARFCLGIGARGLRILCTIRTQRISGDIDSDTGVVFFVGLLLDGPCQTVAVGLGGSG